MTTINTVAFVVKAAGMFACVVDGKQIAKSKHQDYFKYHYAKHDVKALELPITKFVYLDEAGEITMITDPVGALPNAEMRRHALAATHLVQ